MSNNDSTSTGPRPLPPIPVKIKAVQEATRRFSSPTLPTRPIPTRERNRGSSLMTTIPEPPNRPTNADSFERELAKIHKENEDKSERQHKNNHHPHGKPPIARYQRNSSHTVHTRPTIRVLGNTSTTEQLPNWPGEETSSNHTQAEYPSGAFAALRAMDHTDDINSSMIAHPDQSFEQELSEIQVENHEKLAKKAHKQHLRAAKQTRKAMAARKKAEMRKQEKYDKLSVKFGQSRIQMGIEDFMRRVKSKLGLGGDL